MRTPPPAQVEHEARVSAALKEILAAHEQPESMSDLQALVKEKVGKSGAYETLIRLMRGFEFHDKEWWLGEYGHVDTPAHRRKVRARRKARHIRKLEEKRATAAAVAAATAAATPPVPPVSPTAEEVMPFPPFPPARRTRRVPETPSVGMECVPETPTPTAEPARNGKAAASVVSTSNAWQAIVDDAFRRGSKSATVSFEAKEVTVVMGYA